MKLRIRERERERNRRENPSGQKSRRAAIKLCCDKRERLRNPLRRNEEIPMTNVTMRTIEVKYLILISHTLHFVKAMLRDI